MCASCAQAREGPQLRGLSYGLFQQVTRYLWPNFSALVDLFQAAVLSCFHPGDLLCSESVPVRAAHFRLGALKRTWTGSRSVLVRLLKPAQVGPGAREPSHAVRCFGCRALPPGACATDDHLEATPALYVGERRLNKISPSPRIILYASRKVQRLLYRPVAMLMMSNAEGVPTRSASMTVLY